MEDFDVIVRVTCQELYNNLKNNHSIFSDFKCKSNINKLNAINENNEYRCTEIIRDEIGLVYKNYMVFCREHKYDESIDSLKKIYNLYKNLCIRQEQCLICDGDYNKYSEYKKIEGYIKRLESTYGGQTEKYLKKLSQKKLGQQKYLLKALCKDKSKIISEKKKYAIDLLQEKLDNWNSRCSNEKFLDIVYSSERAEYVLFKMRGEELVSKKKIKFNTNFKDIETLQESALKKLRQLNFGIDVVKELNINKSNIKYVDPFIILAMCQENYLDYAKIYLRLATGNCNYKKSQLPFKIKYNINVDYKQGKMTPVRNEIMAIIAERTDLTVSYTKKYKSSENNTKIKLVG